MIAAGVIAKHVGHAITAKLEHQSIQEIHLALLEPVDLSRDWCMFCNASYD